MLHRNAPQFTTAVGALVNPDDEVGDCGKVQPAPRFASDEVVRPPKMQADWVELQPHGDTQSLLHVNDPHAAAPVGAGLAVHPVPRLTSDAVVVPPKIHISLLRLHPQGDTQSLEHVVAAQSAGPTGADVTAGTVGAEVAAIHPGPKLPVASDADVRAPSVQAF